MATATGLEVRVHEGRERAEAKRVTNTVDQVLASLHEIDQMYLLRAVRPTWVMADMDRVDQVLVIRLEARHQRRREMADLLVPAEALVAGARVLRELPEVPPLFAPRTVQRLGGLAEPKDGVQHVTLATYNGSANRPVALDEAVRANAAAAVRPFEVAHGTVTGYLTTLSDAKQKGAVKVGVKTSTNLVVKGLVPEQLADRLRSLWRHRVSVLGRIRRNAQGQPLLIDVEHLEQMPEDNSLRPSTDELLGIGAEWFTDMTVDQFLEQIRE
ncbi:hypothetical protein H5392_02010 [Tessaracoccus sp. MC1865]|uniref:hypothetical protein n=1 Tax=Tessaracoccus sp. MC1865 TaxID=2760310 RepID=UPI0015FFA03C|nr:hypothetical protein [Tessaracoccus sp. MC1865]MBB1482633.1 hypothetical protein [Tessaracoccus sp. MC1865]QTO37916.1 hypothetical protein J7D54_02080 [Tessaracoccus sp. MC1865]